jgi:ABC-2 type transport system ATP-binding protein
LADTGKAVLVSSHILPELADVCDTVGILSAGTMVACGPVGEILRAVRQKRLVEIGVLEFRERAVELLKRAPGDWTPVESDAANGILRYEVQADERQLAQALAMLLAGDIPVVNFYEVPADLEDVFMSLTN